MDSLDASKIDITAINRCLQSVGMETVAREGELEERLNGISHLHLSWIKERETIEERCSKVQADCNNYLNTIDRLQGEIESIQREATGACEKERQTRVRNKTLASKLKAEEDEVKKLTIMMGNKQDHFNHELRKKERETLALRERLSKKIMEKGSAKGGKALNTIPRSAGGRRAVWGDEPREELYKEVVEEQSKRNRELVEENDNLRRCLASLEGELIGLLSTGDDSFLEEGDLEGRIESSINLPYPVIQDTVKTTFDDKLELMREKYRRLEGSRGHSTELESLRKVVESQQLTITEQLVSLEECRCRDNRQNYSDLHDAELESRFQELLSEKEGVEREREVLRTEREELEKLESKIKEDHKRFREERTQLFESNLLATPSINAIKRENTQRSDFSTPASAIQKTAPYREGHLVFSPSPELIEDNDDNVHEVATPEPSRNERVATTEEFHRELSRLDLSNLHGKILNENLNSPGAKSDTGKDLFSVKQSLLNHYMNTPV